VITCNHCGRPNPVNAASCQNCGSPLISNGGGGASANVDPRMIAPDQPPELPAWLETLRSGERPGSSSTKPHGEEAPNFIANQLIDEDMLPSWMRPERRELTDSSPLESYPPRRSAATPAPNTDHEFTPKRGMDASSLIDQQSLPSWLREKQAAGQVQENIPAASLLQPETLPDWLKGARSQAPEPSTAGQHAQPVIPPHDIKGNDLIDSKELPGWMSARNTPAAPSPQPGAQPGLPASSLLDANALPSWLRQADQEAQAAHAQAFPPPLQAARPPVQYNFNTNYDRPPHDYLPPRQGVSPGQGEGDPAGFNQDQQRRQASGSQRSAAEEAAGKSSISASSFIEMDSLPSWLRASEEQRQQGILPGQQSFADAAGQAAFGAPVRPVPSRPRGEMPAHEESAVAANVFASMLGVASAAPYFPGQQAQNASGSQWAQAQQNAAQPQGIGGAAMPNLGVSTPAAPSGAMPPAYPSGSPNYMGGHPGQGYAQPGTPAMGDIPPAAPQQQAGMRNPAKQATDNGSGQTKAKQAKRGFLSTILDWFSR
jgi:hypothetical protein